MPPGHIPTEADHVREGLSSRRPNASRPRLTASQLGGQPAGPVARAVVLDPTGVDGRLRAAGTHRPG